MLTSRKYRHVNFLLAAEAELPPFNVQKAEGIFLCQTTFKGGLTPPDPLFFHTHLVENLKLRIPSNFYCILTCFGGAITFTSCMVSKTHLDIEFSTNF